MFRELFDPIIADYHAIEPGTVRHGVDPRKAYADPLDDPSNQLKPLDPDGVVVLSSRIRLARNLCGYNLPPHMSRREREAVEAEVVRACRALPWPLRGACLRLAELDETERADLERRHLLFHGRDRYMQVAGITADWPLGRGVFLAANCEVMVWVNEEDHLRVIALCSGGNLARTHDLVRAAMQSLERVLWFSWSDRLGYITNCPTNLGTGSAPA